MGKVKVSQEEKKEIQRQARFELARRNFWYFCHTMFPGIYKKDCKYLKEWCSSLQSFFQDGIIGNVFDLEAPPQHCKSLTAQLLCVWILGNYKNKRLVVICYNQILSQKFGKAVRGFISAEKVDNESIVVGDIFDIKVKKGDGAVLAWSIEGTSQTSFLCVTPDSSLTGFPADVLFIDDLVKNAYEANNRIELDKKWDFICNTAMSRLQNESKIIVTMTRWSVWDIAGRLRNHFKDNIKILCYKAIIDEDNKTVLNSNIKTYEQLQKLKQLLSQEIFQANYQQETLESKNRLYKDGFKTYDDIPEIYNKTFAYIDSADEGADYTCMIIFKFRHSERKCYILDILYNKNSMQENEPIIAQKLKDFKVEKCRVEGNNGGNIFARNIKRITEEQFKNYYTIITTFHQSKNKEARINSTAGWCMENIYFKNNWKIEHTDFYYHLQEYQREGKNNNDDAEDALTGVAETIIAENGFY